MKQISNLNNLHYVNVVMTSRINLETILYKNNLDKSTIIDILPKLSSKCIKTLYEDLSNIQHSTTQDTTINIFTDGGCKRNGKENSKGAYAVYFTDNTDSPFFKLNMSSTMVDCLCPTNQKAELLAIEKAYNIIKDNTSLFGSSNITIITDSMYSINCISKWSKFWLQNNWKTRNNENVKNADIIKRILQLKSQVKLQVKLQHTFSHTKKPENKNSQEFTIWYGNHQVDKMVNDALRQ